MKTIWIITVRIKIRFWFADSLFYDSAILGFSGFLPGYQGQIFFMVGQTSFGTFFLNCLTGLCSSSFLPWPWADFWGKEIRHHRNAAHQTLTDRTGNSGKFLQPHIDCNWHWPYFTYVITLSRHWQSRCRGTNLRLPGIWYLWVLPTPVSACSQQYYQKPDHLISCCIVHWLFFQYHIWGNSKWNERYFRAGRQLINLSCSFRSLSGGVVGL